MEKEKSFVRFKSAVALILFVLMLFSICSVAIQAQAVSSSGQAEKLNAASVSYHPGKRSVNTKAVSLKKPVITSIKAGYGKITLKWSKVSGATKYRIYKREKTEKKYSILDITKSLDYTDSFITPGKTYYYVVKAYVKIRGTGYYTEKSDPKKASTNYPYTLTVNLFSGDNSLGVSWTEPTGVTGYQVYRSTTGKSGSYKKIVSTKKTRYYDNNINKKRTYYYIVRAYTRIDGKIYYGKFSERKKIKWNDPFNPSDYDTSVCWKCGRKECQQSMAGYFCIICKKDISPLTCHQKSHYDASHK